MFSLVGTSAECELDDKFTKILVKRSEYYDFPDRHIS